MKNLIYIILLYSYVFPQETIGEGLYSDPLIDYLQDSYTTSNVQSYANARDILYSEIDIDNSSQPHKRKFSAVRRQRRRSECHVIPAPG